MPTKARLHDAWLPDGAYEATLHGRCTSIVWDTRQSGEPIRLGDLIRVSRRDSVDRDLNLELVSFLVVVTHVQFGSEFNTLSVRRLKLTFFQ